MVKETRKLEVLIDQIIDYINNTPEKELSKKLNPKKWSKKEILGHLVDSGINNLQRFTEIQFKEKPYQLRSYNQEKLILANNYQVAKTKDILDLLVAINKRIIDIVIFQTNETLNYEIIYDNEKLNLKYLIEDYILHLEHHTKQIIEYD